MSDGRCLDEGTVVAFLGGRLSAEERAVVERHVAACAACADLTTYAAADIANGSGGGPGRDGRPFVGRLTPGTKVDRYQVLGAIGRGGMGEVYAAYDPELDRRIALKVVHAAGRGRRRALRRGCCARRAPMARLSHPNVVAVHDVGTLGRRRLHRHGVRGGRDPRRVAASAAPRDAGARSLDVFLAAGRGLAAAHAAGSCTATSSRRTCWSGATARVRVMDFGLARLASETADDERAERLRAGAAGGGRARVAHADRRGAGHAGVHGAGAVPGRGGRRARGPVQLLRGAVRGAVRRAARDAGERAGADGGANECGERARSPEDRDPARARRRSHAAIRVHGRSAGRARADADEVASARVRGGGWLAVVVGAARRLARHAPRGRIVRGAERAARSRLVGRRRCPPTVDSPGVHWPAVARPPRRRGSASRRRSTSTSANGPACTWTHAKRPTFAASNQQRCSTCGRRASTKASTRYGR